MIGGTEGERERLTILAFQTEQLQNGRLKLSTDVFSKIGRERGQKHHSTRNEHKGVSDS